MPKYPFLSEEWIAAARGIYDAHKGETPALAVILRANLNITEVPFGSDPLEAHLDTSSGELQLDLGHLDGADVTLTMGYETAKAQIVNQDQSAVMQAFMQGRIKIEGDMGKVLALATAGQGGGADAQELARTIAEELQGITE